MITVSFPSLFIQFYVKGSCPAGLWGKGQFARTHFLEQKEVQFANVVKKLPT